MLQARDIVDSRHASHCGDLSASDDGHGGELAVHPRHRVAGLLGHHRVSGIIDDGCQGAIEVQGEKH